MTLIKSISGIRVTIGGNVGDRSLNLSRAASAIEKNCGRVVKASSLYQTAPWGKEDQAPFLNQALLITTDLEADDLMSVILQTEQELGRKRIERYGPRLIDIDILFFNNDVIERPGLHIPHPRMSERRFVLAPLQEIASQKIHPVFGKTIAELLANCRDPLSVNKIN